MAWFKRQRPHPEDVPLSDHLDAIAAGRPGAVARYVAALADRPLWVGSHQLPAAVDPGSTVVLTEETPVSLLASDLPGGAGRGLLVFTEQAGVHSRAPEGYPLSMPGRHVLALATRGFDGAIVDPHARWQALAASWISDALS